MCPDEVLLAAFVDDEVPSPWKERIEEHLHQCERCKVRAENYRAISEKLKTADNIDSTRLQLAVTQVQWRLKNTLHGYSFIDRFPMLAALNSRRVSVPLPIIALSLLLVVFFAGFAFGIFGARTNSNQALALKTTLPAVSTGNIESLVSTLSQPDPSQIVTIRAPENMVQPMTNATPIYVIYSADGQKPTITEVPLQDAAK